MGESNINRDPNEQIAFANYLEDFATNVTDKCNSVKSNVQNARACIRAANAVEALDALEDSMDEIIKLLSDISDFSTGQKKKGMGISEASEMNIVGKTR